MNIVERAEFFATVAHAAVGQKRKYTGADYIFHPRAVAALVGLHLLNIDIDGPHAGENAVFKNYSRDMIAAAYLHDVVEDTHITISQITEHFGPKISEIVNDLTDVSTLADGNRKERKALDRVRIGGATAMGQFVKCADIIHNCSDIQHYDPKFWVVYKEEMLQTLEVLTKVKNQKIYEHALKSVS